MSSYEFIQLARAESVATVTLNRPPLNILHIPMMTELNAALEPLVHDVDLAAILFRATGKAFCAGVDVADHAADKVGEMMAQFHGIFRKLAVSDALIIAAVDGAALGGGCELATFCDVVLASERARLGQPEVQVGVFPPVAACILPTRIGLQKAIAFNALGTTLDAAESLRIGLVDFVYPAAEFAARVDAYVANVQKLSRPVVRLAKRATAGDARARFLARLDEVERLYANELMKLADAHEGLTAFLEKRSPRWTHG